MRITGLAKVAESVTAEAGTPAPHVGGRSEVSGNVVLPVGARILCEGRVSSQADLLVLGPGPSGAYTTAHRDELCGVRVTRGCYSGTIEGYTSQIDTYRKLSDNSRTVALEYANMIKEYFGL